MKRPEHSFTADSVRRFVRAFLFPLLLLPLASACLQTRYLGQAACGQLELLNRARPIPIVLARDPIPDHVREILRQVRPIKNWSRTQGLTPSDSYEKYADLHREAAVWVVQAAPKLSLAPKTWWFPIVGSVPYLGYFDEKRAHAFAEELAAREGLDVEVREASAYSTLGFLSDPVLSTMIGSGPEAMGDFANVLLHESVHATVYVSGQSAFNESLASFVADRLTVRWLDDAFGAGNARSTAWVQAEAWRGERRRRLLGARAALEQLYASALPDEQKLAEKARILSELAAALKTRRAINNATLAGMQTYATGTDAFARLLTSCRNSVPSFLKAIATLRSGDFPEKQARSFDAVIDRLAEGPCP